MNLLDEVINICGGVLVLYCVLYTLYRVLTSLDQNRAEERRRLREHDDTVYAYQVRVQSLEAQNRKLAAELNRARQRLEQVRRHPAFVYSEMMAGASADDKNGVSPDGNGPGGGEK